MMMRLWQITIGVTVSFLLGTSLGRAADDFGDLKIIRIIPQTATEIAQAHERARPYSCEVVPPGEPLEITGFTPVLTDRDQAELARGRQLLASTRRHMFTVGLDMLGADQAQLPTVSRSQILNYIEGHYVTIQARVQKDPVTSELFLHHRPLAATVAFGKGQLTKEFTEAVQHAIQEFHSLGVYLPRDATQRPKNLRTLVMIYRNLIVQPTVIGDKTQIKPNFEYAFIRGRDATDTTTPQLKLYAFATSEQRKRLHLLTPWSAPNQPANCDIRATVLFTQYSTLGLIPQKSATRSVEYSSHKIVAWEELERYVTQQGWRGPALDNLDRILDAVIDEKL
jgi:hypothetical protein